MGTLANERIACARCGFGEIGDGGSADHVEDAANGIVVEVALGDVFRIVAEVRYQVWDRGAAHLVQHMGGGLAAGGVGVNNRGHEKRRERGVKGAHGASCCIGGGFVRKHLKQTIMDARGEGVGCKNGAHGRDSHRADFGIGIPEVRDEFGQCGAGRARLGGILIDGDFPPFTFGRRFGLTQGAERALADHRVGML